MNKIFISLAAGIVLGILIAPAKGSETVTNIKDKLDEIRDDIDKLFKREDKMLKNAINTVAEGAVKEANRF